MKALLILALVLTGCATQSRKTEALIRLSTHHIRSEQSRRDRDADLRMSRIEARLIKLELANRKSDTGRAASAATREQIAENIRSSALEYGRIADDWTADLMGCESLSPADRLWLYKAQQDVEEMQRLTEAGLKKIYGRVPEF